MQLAVVSCPGRLSLALPHADTPPPEMIWQPPAPGKYITLANACKLQPAIKLHQHTQAHTHTPTPLQLQSLLKALSRSSDASSRSKSPAIIPSYFPLKSSSLPPALNSLSPSNPSLSEGSSSLARAPTPLNTHHTHPVNVELLDLQS